MRNKLIIVGILFLLLGLCAWYLAQQKNITKNKKTPSTQTKNVQEISFTPEQLQQYYATYQDPYVIALRTALNGYLDGTNKGMDSPQLVIKSSKRDGYLDGFSSFSKDYYKGRFIVYAIGDSAAGGKDIAIIFQDKPDMLFRAWVYQLANGRYDLRGFSQDLSYTSEKMLEIQKEYKSLLTERNHSL